MSRNKERLIEVGVTLVVLLVLWVHQSFHSQSKASLQLTREIVKWSTRVDARVSRLEGRPVVVPAVVVEESEVEVVEEGGEL